MAKIVAVVTTDILKVIGGVPVFIEKEAEEREKIAFLLEKMLDASAHDMKNGTFVMIDHKAE